MALKVIGAGFGRTGTDSMREALTILGFGPCHHMFEVNAHYWRELITFYPEAKVVLTYRSAESWWKSFEQTIVRGITASFEPESLGISLIRDKVFGGRPGNHNHALAIYEENVKAVKATVPPERLLVHGLGDGWEPLCAPRRAGPRPALPEPQQRQRLPERGSESRPC